MFVISYDSEGLTHELVADQEAAVVTTVECLNRGGAESVSIAETLSGEDLKIINRQLVPFEGGEMDPQEGRPDGG